MGGGIGAKMLQDFPGSVDGAVLTSPMLEVVTDPFPQYFAQAVEEAAVLMGQGRERRLFDKDDPIVFETNITTRSLVR
jgi:alpha-beta hydrolase superfamily lysophospholipase